MTDERKPEENDAGYLLARAGGGFKLHILPPGWRTAGRWQEALCGHSPGRRRSGGKMKPRGRWYYGGVPFGHGGKSDCEKCAAEYERRLASDERPLTPP